jgi:serine/threonine protein kinase
MNPDQIELSMAISQAVESFWNQLDQSGLIPTRQVKVLARSLASEGVSTDAVAAKKLVELGHLTRFQAGRLLEGRSRGFFFDHYKILDLFGVGGMGWVYRAENTQNGKIVALKVLLDQFKNDRGMVVRFEQEARINSKFLHENIVHTFGYGTAGDLPYVAMELVEGPSILELLRLRERNRLPWEQACDIARQAALALHHVHSAGFVHRDIKPQNLLIDHLGVVKLIDFGLSMRKEGEEGDEFSMAMIFGHECVGTAAFMAPEQVVDSLTADARSDVYGLGCTLYAMLIGDTPFSFSDTKDILKAHQFKLPKNVCEIVPTIPVAVGEIVAKMLAKNPAGRFATAAEAADALSVCATRTPVEFDFQKILAERNKTAREKLAEFTRRQRSSPNASNSTARPGSTTSATGSQTGSMPTVGLNASSPSVSSSSVRRDPFGFENPPTMVLRKSDKSEDSRNGHTTKALLSGMVLLPLSGGAAVPLMKDRFVIGRGDDCDLQIQDPSVSTHHCELQFDGHQWALNDLNSRNGVRVNGDTIKKHLLRGGDTIIIGSSLRLRFSNLKGESSKVSTQRFLQVLSIIAATSVLIMIAATIFKIWNLGGH